MRRAAFGRTPFHSEGFSWQSGSLKLKWKASRRMPSILFFMDAEASLSGKRTTNQNTHTCTCPSYASPSCCICALSCRLPPSSKDDAIIYPFHYYVNRNMHIFPKIMRNIRDFGKVLSEGRCGATVCKNRLTPQRPCLIIVAITEQSAYLRKSARRSGLNGAGSVREPDAISGLAQ